MRFWMLFAVIPRLLHAQETILFHDVRVFDGARAMPHRDVLVQDGKIAQIGARLVAKPGTHVIDGAGKTLLPGLIDAHAHAWGPAPLTTALVFGVTTELDMFTSVDVARRMREEQHAGTATARADLFSAGTLVTAPHGHGTEGGAKIPTITGPDSAQAFVDARIAEGSDYIKLTYDDGHVYGVQWPTLTPETMSAVIAAAHKRGKLAIVHIGNLAGARAAIAAGADGLAHLFVDREPDADFGAFVAAHNAFVVPTLTVLMSISGTAGAGPLAGDPRMNAYLTRQERAMLAQAFPKRPNQPPAYYAAAESTVRQLRVAHVPILAGTDAGNPGTGHGVALHRELELLVQAALTPTEGLAAATAVPARIFHLADRGRIAPGLRADLLLVNGDPTTDITATRDIVGVWKQGVAVDRAALSATIAADFAAMNRPPIGSESGLISDFDDGTTAAKFGAGWSASTDAMAGGKSTAELDVVSGGAAGTSKSLRIHGTISDAFQQAWAGAMFSPGKQMFQPTNLASKRGIHFWARGDGKTYRLFIFVESKGFAPLTQTFVAGPDWKEYVFPFTAFGVADAHDIMALIFGGGPAPGSFDFQIDNVSLR